jgi:hypothetical protein
MIKKLKVESIIYKLVNQKANCNWLKSWWNQLSCADEIKQNNERTRSCAGLSSIAKHARKKIAK